MNEWLGKVKNLLIGGRNKIQLVLPASLNVREIVLGSGELGGNQPLQMDKGLLPVKALMVSLYLC